MLIVVRRPGSCASWAIPASRNQTEENNSVSQHSCACWAHCPSTGSGDNRAYQSCCLSKQLSWVLHRAGGQVAGGRNVCVGLLHQESRVQLWEASVAFQALYPIRVEWAHPQYAPQVDEGRFMKVRIWWQIRCGAWVGKGVSRMTPRFLAGESGKVCGTCLWNRKYRRKQAQELTKESYLVSDTCFGSHGQSQRYRLYIVSSCPSHYCHPSVPWLIGIFPLSAPLLFLHIKHRWSGCPGKEP